MHARAHTYMNRIKSFSDCDQVNIWLARSGCWWSSSLKMLTRLEPYAPRLNQLLGMLRAASLRGTMFGKLLFSLFSIALSLSHTNCYSLIFQYCTQLTIACAESRNPFFHLSALKKSACLLTTRKQSGQLVRAHFLYIYTQINVAMIHTPVTILHRHQACMNRIVNKNKIRTHTYTWATRRFDNWCSHGVVRSDSCD